MVTAAWFFLVTVFAVLIVFTFVGQRRLLPTTRDRLSDGAIWLWGVGLVALLVVLCLVVQVPAYQDADLAVIRLLADSRSAVLESILLVVTTIGDVLPTFLLAAIFAIFLYAREGRVVRALILPVVIFVEIILQLVINGLVGVEVMELEPDLVSGSGGPIPSGGVARVLIIFALGAFLLGRKSPKASAILFVIGQAVVLVELISRLYLGRHFVIDVVGGLIFGALLVTAASWLTFALDKLYERADNVRPARSPTHG